MHMCQCAMLPRARRTSAVQSSCFGRRAKARCTFGSTVSASAALSSMLTALATACSHWLSISRVTFATAERSATTNRTTYISIAHPAWARGAGVRAGTGAARGRPARAPRVPVFTIHPQTLIDLTLLMLAGRACSPGRTAGSSEIYIT